MASKSAVINMMGLREIKAHYKHTVSLWNKCVHNCQVNRVRVVLCKGPAGHRVHHATHA